ncbi:MAG: hypothetical protein ACLQBB_13790, partial [Solirubrobacteraceae bacterium]
IAAGNNNAYLSGATTLSEEGGTNNGFTVTATSADGHTFTITKSANGTTERTCTAEGASAGAKGGCPSGSW